MSRIRAILFDLDDTLVGGFKSQTPGAVLAGVLEVLAELRAMNIEMGVGTNQAGPVWHEVTKIVSPEKENRYPDVWKVANKLNMVNAELHFHHWYISLYDERIEKLVGEAKAKQIAIQVKRDLHSHFAAWISIDKEWRKPEPGMILSFADTVGVSNQITSQEVAFVGDMESDRLAAEAAGVRFVHASDLGSLVEMCKQ